MLINYLHKISNLRECVATVWVAIWAVLQNLSGSILFTWTGSSHSDEDSKSNDEFHFDSFGCLFFISYEHKSRWKYSDDKMDGPILFILIVRLSISISIELLRLSLCIKTCVYDITDSSSSFQFSILYAKPVKFLLSFIKKKEQIDN